jgi:Cu+-exporting ATPase
MALEPMGVPSGDEGPNPELVDMTRRLSGLRDPVDGRSGGDLDHGRPMLLSLHTRLDRTCTAVTGWNFLLATPVVLWAAWPFFRARLAVDPANRAVSTCSR